MARVKYPCLECKNRVENCHTTCEKYLTAKSQNDELKKVVDREKDTYSLAKKCFADRLRRRKNEENRRDK